METCEKAKCQFMSCANLALKHQNEKQRIYICEEHLGIYKSFREIIHGGNYKAAEFFFMSPMAYQETYGINSTVKEMEKHRKELKRALYFRKEINKVFFGGNSDEGHRDYEK